MKKHSFYWIVVFACGCSAGKPTTASVTKIDPKATADAAIKELDKNGNGTIEGDELNACPPLKAALAQFDTNGDKKISLDELKARFERYNQLAADGAVPVNVTVKSKGAPLVGVVVTLTPESFLGPTYRNASGTTDADGIAGIKRDAETQSGVPPGLYRISVTKDGKPFGSVFGREIIEDGRSSGSDINVIVP